MPRRSALLVIALLAVLLAAPAASADTQYGGTGLHKGKSPANPSISLTVRDDATVVARVTFSYSCSRVANSAKAVRVTGRVDGSAFRATGRARVRGLGTLSVTLNGAIAPTSVSGDARVRIGKCKTYTNPFVLRTESAPVGAPAMPAPGTLAQGFTSQSAGGARLTAALRVTNKGLVYVVWEGILQCGRSRFPIGDVTPSRKIAADGTFGGTETYTIRYRGYSERFRVTLRGQFLADGVKGTVRATMRPREPGRRYRLCRTGAQTWAARAT